LDEVANRVTELCGRVAELEAQQTPPPSLRLPSLHTQGRQDVKDEPARFEVFHPPGSKKEAAKFDPFHASTPPALKELSSDQAYQAPPLAFSAGRGSKARDALAAAKEAPSTTAATSSLAAFRPSSLATPATSSLASPATSSDNLGLPCSLESAPAPRQMSEDELDLLVKRRSPAQRRIEAAGLGPVLASTTSSASPAPGGMLPRKMSLESSCSCEVAVGQDESVESADEEELEKKCDITMDVVSPKAAAAPRTAQSATLASQPSRLSAQQVLADIGIEEDEMSAGSFEHESFDDQDGSLKSWQSGDD
jgi:hypothetical protein